MQCHTNLQTGEQSRKPFDVLAVFIECNCYKKKKEDSKEKKNHFIYKNHNDVSGY